MTDLEKHTTGEHLEQVSTNHSDRSDEKLDRIDTNQTLAKIDLDNRQAFKGDDSDGKVHWTVRHFFAWASLAMLYTGSQILLYFTGATLSYIALDIGNASAIG